MKLPVPRIAFEDEHLMVVSKPCGMLSQKSAESDYSLVDWAKETLREPYIGLIHRLDRNTSGLMILAKTPKIAQILSHNLRESQIKRKYLALLRGILEEKKIWSHCLLKNPVTNISKVVKENTPESRHAILTVIPVKTKVWMGSLVTLAEFQLKTGRSHQIRVQSAHEGFPLLGDEKYGRVIEFEPRFERLALHSYYLQFKHPITGEEIEIEDPLPPELDL